MAKAQEALIEVRHIRHSFDDKERLRISMEMANAESMISEKMDELKEVTAGLKAQIAEQEKIMHRCAEQLRTGYEMRSRQCFLTYNNNEAVYTDKETGEILEQHPITEEEQLKLSGQRIDAEQIIRQYSEDE